MIFLQGLYEWLAASLESSVNHFPLIQLVFNSVDKTILYYLIFLVLRAAYLLRRHRKTGKKIPLYKEGLLHALFIYIVLLLQLTVFRNEVNFCTVEYHKISDPLAAVGGYGQTLLWGFRIFGMVQFMGERCLVYAAGLHGALSVQKKMQLLQSASDGSSFFQHD